MRNGDGSADASIMELVMLICITEIQPVTHTTYTVQKLADGSPSGTAAKICDDLQCSEF